MEAHRPRLGWILLAFGALALSFVMGSRFGATRAERFAAYGYGTPQGYYQQGPQAPGYYQQAPPPGYYQQAPQAPQAPVPPQAAPMPPQGYGPYGPMDGPGRGFDRMDDMHGRGWHQGPGMFFGPMMLIGGLLKLLFFGFLIFAGLKALRMFRGGWGRHGGPGGHWYDHNDHPGRGPESDRPATDTPKGKQGDEPPFTGATTSL